MRSSAEAGAREGARVPAAAGVFAAVDPALAVGHAFKAALAAMRRMRGRETRGPGELSDAQFGLLFWLPEASEMSTGELATAAALSPASTTEMLEGLEAAGLVQRARSGADRRVVLIALTERGRELVAERRVQQSARLREALAEFSDEELATAARVLGGLQRMFDARHEGG